MVKASENLRVLNARVTNFGCFRDSGTVPIDDVTALIAENENGKSTFLRALAWWSDGSAFDEEDRWDEADKDAVLDLVSLTFRLNKEASRALKEAQMLGAGAHVRIVRDTAGEYRAEDPDAGTVLSATKEISTFDIVRDSLCELLRSHAEAAPPATEVAGELEAATLGSGVAEALIPRIRGEVIPPLTVEDQASLEAKVVELETTIASPGEISEPVSVMEVLEPYLPRFVYFDDTVDFVEDSIVYAEVVADPSRHRTMVNLAAVAGVDLVNVAQESGHGRQLKSRRAEATVSEDFSKYWQGDPVTIFIQLDESQMTVTIEHKGRIQRPSRRSSGLKWHLGFFVNFRAEVQDDLSGAVLLLDEPGLRLHIKQQPMLLKLFDDLAHDGCVIIYSTHLSHMLAPEKPHTYRPLIADPDTPNATQIVPNITALPSKSDVMQPVRQVLGMGIADAIGLGGRNVIAEGWAERYVLLAMSVFCRASSRTALSATTTVLPAGGSGKKMLPLAAMAAAEKTKAVVLIDDDQAGRSTSTLLSKTFLGGIPVVRTHEEDEETGFELEDLFARGYFVDLVNESHKDVDGYTPIAESDLNADVPVCDAVKAVFVARGLGAFQKLRPAMELQRRVELDQAPDDVTLDQFATLFSRVNSALSRA